MKLLAIANLLPKEEKRKEPKTLGQLAHQLNIGFQVYRMVMRDSLKDTHLSAKKR
jgi:lipoate synthase